MSNRGQLYPAPNGARGQQAILPTNPPEKVNQPVRVAVDFRGPEVKPLAFMWNGRKYVVDKVNLRYKRQHGDSWRWYFAVSDPANSYVLSYDPEDMQWVLEEVYEL